MSLANATMKAMVVAKVKAVAAVCAAAVVVGAGVPAAVTLAQAAATPQTTSATHAPASAVTIAWGEATNGLQVGLVPLGGVTNWLGFHVCPYQTRGRRTECGGVGVGVDVQRPEGPTTGHPHLAGRQVHRDSHLRSSRTRMAKALFLLARHGHYRPG